MEHFHTWTIDDANHIEKYFHPVSAAEYLGAALILSAAGRRSDQLGGPEKGQSCRINQPIPLAAASHSQQLQTMVK